MTMGKLKTGDIIKFDILNRQFADDGFAMGGIFTCNAEELEIFQKIDISTFPSCRDFKGPITKVKHGSYGLVLRKVGRPSTMVTDDPRWEMYDVYEVLTTQFTKRQIFKFNIIKAF